MIVIGTGIVNIFFRFIQLKATDKSLLKFDKKSSIFFKILPAAPSLDWRRFYDIGLHIWQMSRVEM